MSDQKLELNHLASNQNHTEQTDYFKDDFRRLFNMSTRSIQYLKYAQNYLKSMTIAFEHKYESPQSFDSVDPRSKFCSVIESSSKNNTANTTMVSISVPDRQDDCSVDHSPSPESRDQVVGPSCFSMASFIQVPQGQNELDRPQQLS